MNRLAQGPRGSRSEPTWGFWLVLAGIFGVLLFILVFILLEFFQGRQRVGLSHSDALERAYTCLQNRDFDAAITYCNIAIKHDPVFGSPYMLRAHAYEGKGNLDQAIADYTQEIRLCPGGGSDYISRAIAYEKKGDLEEALSDYTTAIMGNPSNQSFVKRCASTRVDCIKESNTGKRYALSEMIALYDDAIRRCPDDPALYICRGSLYRATTRHNERAVAEYSQAIRLDAKCAEAYYCRAEAEESLGEWDNAVSDYSEVIRLGTAHYMVSAYAGRGAIYRMKGETDKAKADFAKSEELSSGAKLD
ncbi:MAG: tetratricopeptide repeat protein [Candidatus Nealsonbacteria bacterium]|nr:tetratricopeptide repeat protein [Candidatus Nealsonbacteria bacterium]